MYRYVNRLYQGRVPNESNPNHNSSSQSVTPLLQAFGTRVIIQKILLLLHCGENLRQHVFLCASNPFLFHCPR